MEKENKKLLAYRLGDLHMFLDKEDIRFGIINTEGNRVKLVSEHPARVVNITDVKQLTQYPRVTASKTVSYVRSAVEAMNNYDTNKFLGSNRDFSFDSNDALGAKELKRAEKYATKQKDYADKFISVNKPVAGGSPSV